MQDGNGYIDRRELALMMRFSGESVSETEIEVIKCFKTFLCEKEILSFD